MTIEDSGAAGSDTIAVVGTEGNDDIAVGGSRLTSGTQTIVIASAIESMTVDGGGGSDTVATTGTTVVPVSVAGVGDAVIRGTSSNDHIVFTPGNRTGEIRAWLNGVLQGTFSPTQRIIAYAEAGDDDVEVSGSIGLPVWLYGGAGNDRLKGGSGNDVLLGGIGDDLLQGNSGRDFLLGEEGADRIIGNADDDIIIGSQLTFQDREAAIAAIMAEWASQRTYLERIANLRGGQIGSRNNGDYFLLADQTVLDDAAKDTLTGSSGEDWFFANFQEGGVADKITDLGAAEFAMDLDWINRVL